MTEQFNPEVPPPADPATDSQAEQSPPPATATEPWYLYDMTFELPEEVARGSRDDLLSMASGRVGSWCVTPEAIHG